MISVNFSIRNDAGPTGRDYKPGDRSTAPKLDSIDLAGVLPCFAGEGSVQPPSARRVYFVPFDRHLVAKHAGRHTDPINQTRAAVRCTRAAFRKVGHQILADAQAHGCTVTQTALGPAWRDFENWTGTHGWYVVHVGYESGLPPQPPVPLKSGPLAQRYDPLIEDPNLLYCDACDDMAAGDYRNGVKRYEYRWMTKTGMTLWPNMKMPMWDGVARKGMRLVVHAEQGYGDQIQFCRYLLELSARGIVADYLIYPPALGLRMGGLMNTLEFGGAIISSVEDGYYDAHIPLCSLPLALGAFEPGGVGFMADRVPYLTAEPFATLRWRKQIGQGGRRVGLVWAGNPEHNNDANRSTTLEHLLSFVPEGENRLFSFQKGDAAKQLTGDITDLADQLNTWADTAAAMGCMDLMVCVDTGIVHLAGAMGVQAKLIIPYEPEWRWAQGKVWYPTVDPIVLHGAANNAVAGETTCANSSAAESAAVPV